MKKIRLEDLSISLNEMSDSGVNIDEKGSGQVDKKLKLDPDNVLPTVLPHLRCAKCQDFFRGNVFDCINNHTTCSLCCEVVMESAGDKSENVVCPMKDCKAKTSFWGKNLTRIVRDLRLKVPCKNRDAGCTHSGIEDELETHEDECGHRKLQCDFGCQNVPFKNFLNHLKYAHDLDYDAKCNVVLCNEIAPTGKDESTCYEDAFISEMGPDGMVFLTNVFRLEGFFRIAVRVMGGKQVAKKYRVEVRASSNESHVSVTHMGPIFPIDCLLNDALTNKESFEISCPKFAFFNHGKDYFGEHNKAKNGDIVLPISVKIEKKKLGLTANYVMELSEVMKIK